MRSVKEQTVFITGATDGIGRIAAQKLSAMGARVLVHGRNGQKVSRVVSEIKENTGNGKTEGYIADFSSLEEVRALAGQLKEEHRELDVLINNAGIGFSDVREVSRDGYELRFAVNYLAPFLLTRLLIPELKNAAPSRIVNVSSAGQSPVNFDDIMLRENYEAWQAYRQSKLALIMFTAELAEQLKADNITVNSLHPGTFLNTKMVTGAGITPLGKAETGAEAEIYLATAPEVQGVTGKYFDRKEEAKANSRAYDVTARRRLWEVSNKYVGM